MLFAYPLLSESMYNVQIVVKKSVIILKIVSAFNSVEIFVVLKFIETLVYVVEKDYTVLFSRQNKSVLTRHLKMV